MLTKSPEVGVDYTIPYDIRGSGDSVFPNTVEEDHDRGIKIKGWRKDELQLLLHKGLRRCRHNEENLDNEIETIRMRYALISPECSSITDRSRRQEVGETG